MDKTYDNTDNIFKYRHLEGDGNNHTLLISEKDQKAYLPYYYSDIKDIYENNKDIYKNTLQVIDKKFILPLDLFKNSSFSRFRESFNLMKYKEKKPLLKCFDLAFELMFHYELNPIIISACRNLDELDIYLDCLEQNDLADFDCFNIKFEVPPSIK